MGNIKYFKKDKRKGGKLGKIEALLNKKLHNVKWGKCKIRDIFNISSSKKRFDANKVQVLEFGKYPYIVRLGSNNGQKGFINEDETFLNDSNTISFGQDTATMFYQNVPYFTGDKIKILKAKDNRFNQKNAQFFIATMKKTFSSFSWGRSNFDVDTINSQNISLPIFEENEIDFDFIEHIVYDLEQAYLLNLKMYLSETGLINYDLTKEEHNALACLEKINFEEFKVTDIFEVKNSRNILSRDIVENSGDIPYLCASTENNSVCSYISYDEEYLDKGNCIFIGGKTFVVTYQENDFYSNDSHNLILYLKDAEKRNKHIQLFIAACIIKSLGNKYYWGDSISNKKIQKDTIWLPAKQHKPDYETMEVLASAIQKLVVKGVVLYIEKKYH